MLITDKKEVNRLFYKVKKALEKKNSRHKLIYVGTAQWCNEKTMTMQKVDNIYMLCMESCARPIIINSISLWNGDDTNKYIANEYYSHTNISGSTEEYQQMLIINNEAVEVKITGQEFCNPLTMEHLYNGNEKDIRGLIKANLLSQNFDDSFSTIYSVDNGEMDKAISCVTRESSAIEMLFGKSGAAISCMAEDDVDMKLNNIKAISPKTIWAKRKDDEYYKLVDKKTYRLDRHYYSDYYPAFDYNYIKKLNIETPKSEYDLGVFGLGSAGSAILDQVCRSNWIKTIYLCDYDYVEEKNLINQWYTRSNLEETKTSASYTKLKDAERKSDKIEQVFTIKYDTKKFQEVDYANKKFKYVVSAFDSIGVRQEFLDCIKSGIIEAEYLIDCRYLDLSGSVYIIDLANKEEVDFYEANLNADAELLKEKIATNAKEMLTKEELKEFLARERTFEHLCRETKTKYFGYTPCRCDGGCGGEECVNCFYENYKSLYPVKGIDYETENTCIKQNYIDIYKYIGAIVFGAMRNMQNDLQKPFTLLEAQTDIKGLPNYMIVKA